MLKYLIIVIDKASPSYCHYSVPNNEHELMDIDILKKAIRFAMVENLNVQYVLPQYSLPKAYSELIGSYKGTKISSCYDDVNAEILVVDNPYKLPQKYSPKAAYVIRVNRDSFKDTYESIMAFASKVQKVNIVFSDVDNFDSNSLIQYSAILEHSAEIIKRKYVFGQTPQINLLTDRILLDKMNNCNAGCESVAVCPDGKFYACPAFYYDESGFNIGDLEHGIAILNSQLYRLDHAPLCRKCDAYQCKRCIWLNCTLTNEVGIPSAQQCKMAHIERNASRKLLQDIKNIDTFFEKKDIPAIDYLDPLEVKLKKGKNI